MPKPPPQRLPDVAGLTFTGALMSRKNYIFTSESVSEGHPDKVCDRISDAVLDAFLAEDPRRASPAKPLPPPTASSSAARSACPIRTSCTNYMGKIDDIARACIKDIGYEQDKFHRAHLRDHRTCLHEQSAHIAQGVDAAGNKDEGAGDQGIMFGYADERDAGADAGADPLCPCDPAPSGRGAQIRQRADPAPRRQDRSFRCATRTASRSR